MEDCLCVKAKFDFRSYWTCGQGGKSGDVFYQ
jgi:hypothetical protein